MIELAKDRAHLVIKRDGRLEPYDPQKLRKVIEWAVKTETGIPENIVDSIVNEILQNMNVKIYDKIHITELYKTLIQTINNMITRLRPFFTKINRNLFLLQLHKEVWGKKIAEYPHIKEVFERGIKAGVYNPKVIESFSDNEIEELNKIIKPERDFTFPGFMEVKSYYNKYSVSDDNGVKFELPQHIALRQAIFSFWQEPKEIRLKLIKDLYDWHSKYFISRATPILSNSLAPYAQMASCVLINIGDSAESINAAVNAGGLFSKYGGGVAFAMRYIRAIGSRVGKRGKSSGMIPFIRLIQSVIEAYDQLGVRKGAGIVYYDWWHLEIFELLELKEESGKESLRARNLQYAMTFNEILIERALFDEEVTLFDPKEVPELIEAKSSDEFKKWYLYYENKEGIRKQKVKAVDILEEFFKQRYETGNLYEFFDDNVQDQNMFKEKVYSSNLCLAGDTKIQILRNGKEMEIELKDVQAGDYVLSKNLKTGEKEYKAITRFMMTSPKAKVMRITDGATGKSIVCTPDHKIYTKNRGYVEARNLRPNDILDLN
jgi:ribonucleoside-diphosphate reductase alpha chain